MIYIVRFYNVTHVLEGPEGLNLGDMWDQFKRDFDGSVGAFMPTPGRPTLESRATAAEYYSRREATITAWCERWGQTYTPTLIPQALLDCFLEMIRVVCQCNKVACQILNVV